MARSRIHDDQVVDESFISEREFNDFHGQVVITGTLGTDDTELLTTFDDYLPGRGLIIAGSGIVVTTGTNFIEITNSGGGGGSSDHGLLTGLLDDDHTQYILEDGTRPISADWDNIGQRIRNTGTSEVTGTEPSTPATGLFWLDTSISGSASPGADHGLLIGLADDDHVQYLLHNGTRSLTEDWDNTSRRIRNTGTSEVTGTEPSVPVSGLFWLDTSVSGSATPDDHGELSGLADDDHPQYGHLSQNETVSGDWDFSNTLTANEITAVTGAFEETILSGEKPVSTTLTKVFRYTGTGSSGLQITLSGINRADYITGTRHSSEDSVNFWISIPDGDTGDVVWRTGAGNGNTGLDFSAAAAGEDQILTINNTSSNMNNNNSPYRIMVMGIGYA